MSKDDVAVVSIRQVCEMTTLGRTALWKLIKTGEFPQPFELSSRRKGFLKTEVVSWIEAKAGSRRAEKQLT